jgi:hypothetical protein
MSIKKCFNVILFICLFLYMSFNQAMDKREFKKLGPIASVVSGASLLLGVAGSSLYLFKNNKHAQKLYLGRVYDILDQYGYGIATATSIGMILLLTGYNDLKSARK